MLFSCAQEILRFAQNDNVWQDASVWH